MENIDDFVDYRPPAYVPTQDDIEAADTVSQPQEYLASENPNIKPSGESFGPRSPEVSTDVDGNQQTTYYGANGEAVGYDDASGAYKSYEPENENLIVAGIKSFGSLFGMTKDANGRQQQSFAASIVLGAAQSALASMSANKRYAADKDMANLNSSNRIKEASEQENRIRSAASAMPATNARGTRTVSKPSGLLSQAR